MFSETFEPETTLAAIISLELVIVDNVAAGRHIYMGQSLPNLSRSEIIILYLQS